MAEVSGTVELRVVFLSGKRSGDTAVVTIEKGARISLGRVGANHVLVPDPPIAAFHATVVNDGAGLLLEDNRSANGIRKGGARVEKARLRSGDRFVLGGPAGAEVELHMGVGVAGAGGAAERRAAPAAASPAASPPSPGEGKPLPVPLQPQALPGSRTATFNPPLRQPEDEARDVLRSLGLKVIERAPDEGDALVFRAERAEFGQEVLASILLRRDVGGSAAGRRFLRQARLAARLRHPNVIALLDVRKGDGFLALLFESLRGRTLADDIRERGRLDARSALAIGACVARGLVHLHGLGMAHRDPRPSNVLLTSENEVKITGLGFLKSLGGEAAQSDATAVGEVIGSLAHMAPEQVAAASTVDARADIYALGAVIFHAIAGRPPHASELRARVKDIAAPAPSLADAAPGTPAPVVALVAKALENEPARRFPDAASLLAAIEAASRACDPGSSPALAPLPSLESGAPSGSQSTSDGFAGSFSGMQLVELLQMVELHRGAGSLTIQGERREGVLEFADGRLVRATCGAESGVEAAYALLAEPKGRFQMRLRRGAEAATVVPADAPTLSSVLFETMRRGDEAPA